MQDEKNKKGQSSTSPTSQDTNDDQAGQASEPEDTTPANFQLGILLPKKINIPVPEHDLSFDVDKFLRLLAGSVSLNREEKRRIIETIPKLQISQIDELIRIFEEEKEKFAQLPKSHVPQLEKLAKQHLQEWLDIEASYKSEKKKADDQAAADDIRKSLGL